jgi:hypothetical protein
MMHELPKRLHKEHIVIVVYVYLYSYSRHLPYNIVVNGNRRSYCASRYAPIFFSRFVGTHCSFFVDRVLQYYNIQ